MKAEHRKELETNILADRMGTLIKKVKEGPKRRSIVYLFLILLAFLVLFIGYRYWKGDPTAVMSRWIEIDTGDLAKVIQDNDNNNTRKVSRLQFAYQLYINGVRDLAARPLIGLNLLDNADNIYRQLEEDDCKDDKEWKAEALYGRAIIEEARAAVDAKKLGSAKKKFEELAKDYEDTFHGALAKDRLKKLTENYKKTEEFYKELDIQFSLAAIDQNRRKQNELKQKAMPKVSAP
jgi:hypothetical protein